MQLKFIICNMDLSFEKKIIIITRVLKVIMEAVFFSVSRRKYNTNYYYWKR